MQTSSEIVWKAIRGGGPERLPRDYWILPAAEAMHGPELDRLQREFPMDFARVGFHPPLGEGRYDPGRWRDEWGAVWENHTPGQLGLVVDYPVAEWSALETWTPPFDLVDKGFERAGEELRAAGTLFKQGGDLTLFHRLTWLRPQELLYLDLLEDSTEMRALFDSVVEWNSRRLDAWMQHDYECIHVYDDWGTQTSLFVSPDLWRERFKPVYADWFARIRKSGRIVSFHTDGWVTPIIEDLIEMGVELLNCQVAVMGEETLAEKYAGRVCFWGELDRQLLLPRGTPDEVEAAAEKMKRLFAKREGGLVAQFEIGWDVPPANFRRAVETFAKWRGE